MSGKKARMLRKVAKINGTTSSRVKWWYGKLTRAWNWFNVNILGRKDFFDMIADIDNDGIMRDTKRGYAAMNRKTRGEFGKAFKEALTRGEGRYKI